MRMMMMIIIEMFSSERKTKSLFISKKSKSREILFRDFSKMATCSDVKERFDMLTHDDIPFGQRWEKMKPTINKLLQQINVSR